MGTKTQVIYREQNFLEQTATFWGIRTQFISRGINCEIVIQNLIRMNENYAEAVRFLKLRPLYYM